VDDDFTQLRELLSNSDAETRGMAAIALGNIPDPQAVDMLLELLDDEDQRVVCAAIQSLGMQGDLRATPRLVELEHTGDVEVRCCVLSAIAQIADPRAFATVVTALFDVDDQVRRNAAAAIGRLGDKRALEPLYQLLNDEFNWVRANAVLSLYALADPRSVEPVKLRLATETDETARGNLILALVACDHDEATRAIEMVCDERETEKVRVSAAIALANLAEDSALPDEPAARGVLISLLRDTSTPDEVRAACAWSLGRFECNGSSVDALCDALEDDYDWVVRYAIESLALLKDVRAIPALERLRRARDDDEELTQSISDAIRELSEVSDSLHDSNQPSEGGSSH
jgi:HEAT repeat protein